MTTTMQANLHLAEQDAREREKREEGLLEAVILDTVLGELGRPTEEYRVQVKRLWGGTYRVNVLVGPDVTSFKVAHSYFLRTDGNGKILSASPPLKRVY